MQHGSFNSSKPDIKIKSDHTRLFNSTFVQAGLAMSENCGIILLLAQFRSNWPETFTVFFWAFDAYSCLLNLAKKDFKSLSQLYWSTVRLGEI